MKTQMIYEVFVVGTGKAGAFLARSFAASGVKTALISRRKGRRRLGSVQVFSFDEVRFQEPPKFVLLAVPDAAIREAAEVAVRFGLVGTNTLVGHLSGALDSRVLVPPIAPRNAFSAHPLKAFPPPRSQTPASLVGTLVSIEASSPKTISAVKALFRKVGVRPCVISAEKKALYHAAAVLATSFPYFEAIVSAKLLKAAGIKDATRVSALFLSDVAKNFLFSGDLSGLTGPFARADIETLRIDLSALKRFDPVAFAHFTSAGLLLASLLHADGRLREAEFEAIKNLFALATGPKPWKA